MWCQLAVTTLLSLFTQIWPHSYSWGNVKHAVYGWKRCKGIPLYPFAYIWKEKDGAERKESVPEKIKSSQRRKYEKGWMGGENKLLQKEEWKWIGGGENGKVRRHGDNMSNRWPHVKEWPVFRQAFRQYLFCFPKAEVPESVQCGPRCLQCASSSSCALGTGWVLLHPTIPVALQESQASDAGSSWLEKSQAALGHGCLPLPQLFTASCLSHFASCHKSAPDTCAWHSQHLTPCLGSPASSCCH